MEVGEVASHTFSLQNKNMANSESREDILGFKPQKEIVYNKLLPYSDKLDEESLVNLAEIKAHLGRAVQLHDIKTGANHWVSRLSKFIRLYGRKFSKEDHIAFIKLLYELVIIPDLEFALTQKFATVLITLLKKRELLSRQDLVLPWRPLYKILESTINSSYEHHGLQLYPPYFEGTMKGLVGQCRVYFPIEATQEMLDEWRPLLCPWDVTMGRGLELLEMFLPTLMMPEEQDKGYKLWLPEFLSLWESCLNTPTWEANLVNLFARVACHNIGCIDWEPYIPQIFTRLLRSFNLPVGSNSVQVSRVNMAYETYIVAQWIVALLGKESTTQEHISKLFKALETFYHPSNNGRWNLKLQRFMVKLSQAVIARIHKERYKAPTWEASIPKEKHLSDEDITSFVESLKPAVFLAMFSKLGTSDSGTTMQQLALLRPELIIPTLLDKMYPAMETLTEPHRLTSCLLCIVSVSRQMVSNLKFYPQGRHHLVPLLTLSLPGIDSNDFRKTLMTFQLISTFTALAPIIDCSECIPLHPDLSEDDRELCSATSEFENFVLQFLDRIFALIEVSSQEVGAAGSDKLSAQESMLEVGLVSTASSVFHHCSASIFKSALKKIFRFLSTNVFEVQCAGRLGAGLLRAATKANPELVLKKFVPHCCQVVKSHTIHPELQSEEELDNELLWNLLLLSEMVRCDGSALMQYKSALLDTMKKTVYLVNKKGNQLAVNLLRHVLKSLTLTYPLNYGNSNHDLDKPLSEWVPCREWGKPGDLHNLNIRWHMPSAEEKQFATEILETFLLSDLQTIKDFMDGKTIPSEELERRLGLIWSCIIGAGSLLPVWKGESLQLAESLVELKTYDRICSCGDDEITINGQNIRQMVAEVLRTFLSFMLAHHEDDTKNLLQVIKLYSSTLFYFGSNKDDFDSRWKSFHVVKRALEDKLHGKKLHIRALLVDRTQLQHELRVQHKNSHVFTELHKDMFDDMLSLSVSHYSNVRKRAQSLLATAMHNVPYSYRFLLPRIVKYLEEDPNTPDYQFKGALYVVLGDKKRGLCLKRNWDVMNTLWPAIAKAQHTEKPSVLKVIDTIADRVHKDVSTTAVCIKVSDNCVENSKLFWLSQPQPVLSQASEAEIKQGLQEEETRNEKWLESYNKLANTLVDLVDSGDLMWKFRQMTMEFLGLLIRKEVAYPARAVQMFVRNTVCDVLSVRKLCLNALSAILKIQKRPHKMMVVNPYEISNTKPPSSANEVCPGPRPDNKWHLYNSQDRLDSKEKWENCVFIEKTHWGFYSWPKKLQAYSPSSEQPKLGRTRDEMTEVEQALYDSFTNQEFVDKLIRYLSLEDRKGKDKFSLRHFEVFKGLFRNYDDAFVHLLRPHLERLVSDVKHETHEHSHKCAAEITAGLIRGSKHWTYEKTSGLWEWLIPLLKTAVTTMGPESVQNWGTCFATASENRDPRKLHWLLEFLLDDPLKGEGGSLQDASRLYVLQGALAQQEWRVPCLLHRLLDYLQPQLAHSYKNVRERVGSVLTNVFLYDYPIPHGNSTNSPLRTEFVSKLLPKLEILENTLGTDEKPTQLPHEELSEPMEVGNCKLDDDDEERKNAVKLVKTVLQWLKGNFGRMFYCVTEEIIKLLPVLCPLLADSTDDELKQDTEVVLACMAQALIHPNMIPVILKTIREVAALASWHARTAILTYIQVMVFCNLFLLKDGAILQEIEDLVLHLLCDDQLEVRELAAVTIGGFLHCGFIKMDQRLLKHFERLSSTKIKKRRQLGAGNASIEANLKNILKRHAGILGLGACVEAYPYEVPEFIPQILVDLTGHLDDPQPIQMTVKKTLSNFRRTHHDSWQDHKHKFTDDQLVVLTDVLVSPNYYA